jgi:glutamyl-tRNA reductase
MNYVMVGLNHRTAPVGVRELIAFDGERLKSGLRTLLACPEINETSILSTCNRVEIYAATTQPVQAGQEITAFLTQGAGNSEALVRSLVTLTDADAVTHLFAVAASVDAMVVGENQVLAQVKDAYQAALQAGATGAFLNKLFHRALYVAKRVKSETEIGQGNVSVGSSAVALARKIFGNLSDKTVVLLGAGEIGELVVRHLNDEQIERTFIVNRTYEKALELERAGLGSACELTELGRLLRECDVLITSLSGSLPELAREALARTMQERHGAPLFIIDLGVPRNVAANVNELNDVYLYNVDDLKIIAEEGKSGRHRHVADAKNIIDEEVRLFYELHLDSQAVPAIANLNRKFEALRRQELERTLAKMPSVSAADRQAIDRLTQSLVSKILHDPILTLKNQNELREPAVLQVFKKIFRLDEEE